MKDFLPLWVHHRVHWKVSLNLAACYGTVNVRHGRNQPRNWAISEILVRWPWPCPCLNCRRLLLASAASDQWKFVCSITWQKESQWGKLSDEEKNKNPARKRLLQNEQGKHECVCVRVSVSILSREKPACLGMDGNRQQCFPTKLLGYSMVLLFTN